MVGLSRRGSYSTGGRAISTRGRGGATMRGGLGGSSRRISDTSTNGFSAPVEGSEMLDPCFMGMLLNISSNYPKFSNGDWAQNGNHPNAFSLSGTTPILVGPPRRGSASNSQSSSNGLIDEEDERENDQGVEEDEVVKEGPTEAETSRNTTAEVVIRRPGALKDGKKRKAWIGPGTLDVLEPSGTCSRWITAKLHEKLDANYLSWGQVSAEEKKGYFDEFQKGFEWEPSEEQAIFAGWIKKANKSYTGMTCRTRKMEAKPNFMLENVWGPWKKKWEDPTFKIKSAKMKANQGRASTHTGGSRSFSNHGDFLKEKFKVDDISPHTLFQHNHSRGHDMRTWVSAKAHSVEAYQAEVASSASNGTRLNETEAFFKAAGGRKKGGVYGVRDTMSTYYGSSSGNSMQSGGASGRSLMGQMEQLQQALQVERAEREKMQTQMAAERGKMQTQMAAERGKMQTQMGQWQLLFVLLI